MDFGELDALIDDFGVDALVTALDPFLTEERKRRIETVLSGRLESIQVAVEHPEDPHNAAAIVRSAEALGALHVHVVDAPTGALHAPSTTQGAFCWVHTHHHARLEDLLAVTKGRGSLLAGAVMEGELPVDELPVDRPLCVLFGNEGTGLTREALAACDLTFRIPMFGMSESMNLSVCAAITLYALTHKRRKLLAAPGELAGPRLRYERARYYARSVDRRLLDGLMSARIRG
jgi:tRNA (guanosine-2'-O-)-methyltransferase